MSYSPFCCFASHHVSNYEVWESNVFEGFFPADKSGHEKVLCSRRVTCGNRVKVSSIVSSGESIKPDLHKEGPDWKPAMTVT